MGFYRGPHVVTDGLILWLDAANPRSYSGSGTTWRDLSGNSNNGALNNGPTFSSANLGSIVFDGTNDFVAGFSNPVVSTQMTAEVWHKLDTSNITGADTTVGSYILGRESSYRLVLFLGGIYQFVCSTSNNSWYSPGTSVGSRSRLSDQTWNHIVGTYDGTKLSIYINGALETTGSVISGNISGGSNFGIMLAAGGNITFGKGGLGATKIYNRALLAQEVKQNYDALKGRYNLV